MVRFYFVYEILNVIEWDIFGIVFDFFFSYLNIKICVGSPRLVTSKSRFIIPRFDVAYNPTHSIQLCNVYINRKASGRQQKQ